MTSAGKRLLTSVNIPNFHAVSPPSFLFPFCVLTAEPVCDYAPLSLSLAAEPRVPASRASLSLERGHGSVGLKPHLLAERRTETAALNRVNCGAKSLERF